MRNVNGSGESRKNDSACERSERRSFKNEASNSNPVTPFGLNAAWNGNCVVEVEETALQLTCYNFCEESTSLISG